MEEETKCSKIISPFLFILDILLLLQANGSKGNVCVIWYLILSKVSKIMNCLLTFLIYCVTGCMECEFGDNCRAGNKLWTQFCSNSEGQQFVWIPNLDYSGSQNYGSLKLVHFDLCLERMTTNTYQMQKCDPGSSSQVLVGWNPSSAFELHPVQNQAKCINQHHHPREEEDIANTACATAAKHHTNLWRVYKNENAGKEMSRLRRPECTERNPCDMCQVCDSVSSTLFHCSTFFITKCFFERISG